MINQLLSLSILTQIYEYVLNPRHLQTILSQLSSIEYLVFNHDGIFNDVPNILCHTPMIHCLEFAYSLNESIDPIILQEIQL